MDDSIKYKDTPPIAEENWMNYFQCLHSISSVCILIRTREDILMQSQPLHYFITLLPVHHKLFNTVLNLGTVPKNWCNSLITPIFKSGVRNDPSNYRGICVSSCLGKLFFSILNQRLLEHVTSLNILHKSQIGFLLKNWTSDHLLTLQTLIDKYIHCHGEKVYTCFVDFRKAFDSVWKDGLLYKLLQIGVGGRFYKLIKNIYSNSSCALKIGTSQTRSFSYSRGIHQGCILSPLLFNLYVNDLLSAFQNTLSDTIILPNGTKLNSLLYADDLINCITI